MAQQYRLRFLYGLAPAALLLALAGCDKLRHSETMTTFREVAAPGGLGRLIDRPPAPVPTTQGGPSGVLIGGRFAAEVPESAIDQVVAPPLREWLTPAERRNLAAASETAAAAPTGAAVVWTVSDGKNTQTAAGSAMPVADVYRSKRGAICRDVAQRVDKNKAQHAHTVTLCRDAQADGPVLWLIGAAE